MTGRLELRAQMLAVVAALALSAPALAGGERPTLSELEREFVCPTCGTTLDRSDAPIARQMKAFIRARIAAGDSESEIRARLVDEFGRRVLAEPPSRGFDLLAWLAPLVAAGAGGALVAALVWRWSRERRTGAEDVPGDPATNGRVTLDPELERRLDEELARFG